MKDLLRILRLARPYAGWLSLGILLSLVTLIANVTLMAVSGWFITAMAVAGAAGVSMNYFTPAAIIRACAIVRTAGRYGERLVTHEATMRLLASLRVWFYQQLEPLAPARLQHYRGGDLLSRIRADIDTLDHFYLRILVPTVTAALGGTIFCLFLLLYDAHLALVLLLGLLLSGVAVPWFVRHLGDTPGRRAVVLRAELRAATIDDVQGMSELQVYGATKVRAERFADLSRQLAREQERLAGLGGMSQGMLVLTANITLWMTVWIAIPLVHVGSIAPPELTMLALFTLAAFESVMPLPGAFQALGETRAAAERILDIVDAEPEVPEPAAPAPLPQGFAIRFQGVDFRYPGATHPTLEGIAFELNEGGKLAIIGPSGSGKSTIVQLMLRFRAPGAGSITLAGEDTVRLCGEDVRRRIAVVSQHTDLFTGTMRENLLLADPAATRERLEQACRAAEIHDFIISQPDGYDTWIGEAGTALSGGEARRLAIARAVLKDAPILVLDEPTEGLDNSAARALMSTLTRLMAQRSVLLITHRPEGLDAMDQVLVLEQGRITPFAQTRGDAVFATDPKRRGGVSETDRIICS